MKQTRQKIMIKYIVVAVILAIVFSWFIFSYYPKMARENAIKEYKKNIFNNVLCQVSCPLAEQKIVNTTQMQLLPEIECIKNCTDKFKGEINKTGTFTLSELTKDNLGEDMTAITNECLQKGYSNITASVNSSVYYSCIKEKLEGLKENYSYLD